jgi:hypothetical protein
MTDYDVAAETTRSLAAKERLEIRFNMGRREQALLVEKVAKLAIRDKFIHPKAMVFDWVGPRPVVHYADLRKLALELNRMPTQEEIRQNARSNPRYFIHSNALNRMCGVAGVPIRFVRRLLSAEQGAWESELYGHVLDTLFYEGQFKERNGTDKVFLHRIVGSDSEDPEVRGFLSRSFNRKLFSLPMLRGFVEACTKAGAQPVEAHVSDVRFGLSCVLPHVFEPAPGEFVSFGPAWSNSDFGAGRHKISLICSRISSGGIAVLQDRLSQVHIGSVIEEAEFELDDKTLEKEAEAQVLAIQDAVSKLAAPESINRMLRAIAAAMKEEVSWSKLKGELGRYLRVKEVENVKLLLETGISDIADLPPVGRTEDGSPVATRWWASNVVSWMASKEVSSDRKEELQKLAGNLLT